MKNKCKRKYDVDIQIQANSVLKGKTDSKVGQMLGVIAVLQRSGKSSAHNE
jgi:hypothetical protein